NLKKMKTSRNRIHYLFLIILTIGVGLFSRSRFIPMLIYPYLGDLLYCLMYYWIIGFLFPKMSYVKVLLGAMAICFAIEISQLVRVDWLNEIRNTTFGKLVLGNGFLWSDLVCYTLGGLLGVGLEKKFIDRRDKI
ncbi:MAG: DUF2809 domain-containing protein, partial [Saprospiraceae bacterium]